MNYVRKRNNDHEEESSGCDIHDEVSSDHDDLVGYSGLDVGKAEVIFSTIYNRPQGLGEQN